MIKRCKNIEITDINLIRDAVEACLDPPKKRKRNDTIRLFSELLGTSKTETMMSLFLKDDKYYKAIDIISDKIQKALEMKELNLSSVRLMRRIDPNNGKEREIAILDIWHLLIDHVAVFALSDLLKRLGMYQVSGIPGKGAGFGAASIKKWIKKLPSKVYFTKLDVKDFYKSVDKKVLMDWLRKRIANDDLLWLIGESLNSIKNGIPIGSYLSQTLANVYMSDLYHKASETYHLIKRGKSIKIFRHILFYMDDMLFIGTNKRAMIKSLKDLIAYAKNKLALVIKPNWCVQRLSAIQPIDMMGYRFTYGKTSVRRKIHKKARRMAVRALRLARKNKKLCITAARRMVSYYGYTCRTVWGKKGLNTKDTFNLAIRAIKNYENLLYRTTRASL